jgi:hypothetical protein
LADGKLGVLFNEACRQRLLDVQAMSNLIEADKLYIERVMKVHGAYTEGYYENQLSSLMERISGKIR